MVLSPDTQTCRNPVCLRINKRPGRTRRLNAWRDRLLLPLGHPGNAAVTASLYHPTDEWPLLVSWATPTLAWETVSTSFAPLALSPLRRPWMACHDIGFVALPLVGQCHGGLFFTLPSRKADVSGWRALRLTSSAWAIWSLTPATPGHTDTTPPHAGGDDVPPKWCESDPQSVGDGRYTPSADGRVPCHHSHA